MIGRLLLAWISSQTGPECAYSKLARASVEGRLAEEPS